MDRYMATPAGTCWAIPGWRQRPWTLDRPLRQRRQTVSINGF